MDRLIDFVLSKLPSLVEIDSGPQSHVIGGNDQSSDPIQNQKTKPELAHVGCIQILISLPRAIVIHFLNLIDCIEDACL